MFGFAPFGGAGGSRTPVRKPIHTSFYTLSQSFESPRRHSGWQDYLRAALWLRQELQGYHSGRWLLCHAQTEAAALIGRTEAALRQLLIQIYCLRLILSCPFVKSLGELCVLNGLHSPRRNLYDPVGIANYTLLLPVCQHFYTDIIRHCYTIIIYMGKS